MGGAAPGFNSHECKSGSIVRGDRLDRDSWAGFASWTNGLQQLALRRAGCCLCLITTIRDADY